MHPLKTLLDQRHESNLKGIVSICTASPMVIEACFDYYKNIQSPFLRIWAFFMPLTKYYCIHHLFLY